MSQARKIKSATNATMRLLLKASLGIGFVGVLIAAPNALQAIDLFIDKYDKGKKRKPRFREQVRRSGYYTVKKIDEETYAVALSKKGVTVANNIIFEDYTIPLQNSWDGKWRILLFDVAEKDRRLRDAMRRKINELGMRQLQGSVYVYPYPIDELIEKLKAAYPIQFKSVIGVEAQSISENWLEAEFRKAKIL